jgi:predicted lactoylglutathione lyase
VAALSDFHTNKGDIMKNQIFVNLPVKDLDKSKAFFSSLGFGFNPQFSGENAACMVVAEGSIQVMLMPEAFFKSLIDKPVVQAKEANEVIVCLTCDSREEVASLVAKAVAAGGRTPHPLEDHGFMVTQGFEDIDGHLWNLVWMAPQH